MSSSSSQRCGNYFVTDLGWTAAEKNGVAGGAWGDREALCYSSAGSCTRREAGWSNPPFPEPLAEEGVQGPIMQLKDCGTTPPFVSVSADVQVNQPLGSGLLYTTRLAERNRGGLWRSLPRSFGLMRCPLFHHDWCECLIYQILSLLLTNEMRCGVCFVALSDL